MTSYYDWVQMEIPAEKIEELKQTPVNWKARFMTDNRWLGRVGEWAFEELLIEAQQPFENLTKSGPSWTDFKLNNKNIDVKTISTDYFPRENYGCNVDASQHRANKEADIYVFVRYIKSQSKAVFVGYCSKDYFSKNAVLRMADTAVTNSFTPKAEFYEILISELNPITSLIQKGGVVI